MYVAGIMYLGANYPGLCQKINNFDQHILCILHSKWLMSPKKFQDVLFHNITPSLQKSSVQFVVS